MFSLIILFCGQYLLWHLIARYSIVQTCSALYKIPQIKRCLIHLSYLRWSFPPVYLTTKTWNYFLLLLLLPSQLYLWTFSIFLNYYRRCKPFWNTLKSAIPLCRVYPPCVSVYRQLRWLLTVFSAFIWLSTSSTWAPERVSFLCAVFFFKDISGWKICLFSITVLLPDGLPLCAGGLAATSHCKLITFVCYWCVHFFIREHKPLAAFPWPEKHLKVIFFPLTFFCLSPKSRREFSPVCLSVIRGYIWCSFML